MCIIHPPPVIGIDLPLNSSLTQALRQKLPINNRRPSIATRIISVAATNRQRSRPNRLHINGFQTPQTLRSRTAC